MVSDPHRVVIVRPQGKTYYERWMPKQGILPDVCRIPLRHWKRLGRKGAYSRLRGLHGHRRVCPHACSWR